MRHSVYFLVLVLCASAIGKKEQTEEDRKGRVFSLFSVVTFPNTDCALKSNTSVTGRCVASSECKDGDVIDGTCAAGFGVCCKYRYTTCGSTINKNSSYIETTVNITSPCTFNIKPVQSDICQIRLDFLSFSITTNAIGDCTAADSDNLVIKSPSDSTTTVCGTLSGHHIYVENGSQTSATIDLTYTKGTGLTARSPWTIKVTQIECTNPGKAPTDCFQYFTGAGGTFQSLNYAGLVMLRGLQYTICIRQELGFCKIDYSDSTSTDFLLGLSTATTSLTDTNCANDYLFISRVDKATLFCGLYFSEQNGESKSSIVRDLDTPFAVGVRSLSTTVAGSKGFKLNYNQVPCS